MSCERSWCPAATVVAVGRKITRGVEQSPTGGHAWIYRAGVRAWAPVTACGSKSWRSSPALRTDLQVPRAPGCAAAGAAGRRAGQGSEQVGFTAGIQGPTTTGT